MLDMLRDRVNADAALVRRGRFVDLTFLVGVGDDDFLVTVEKGRIVSVAPRRLSTESGRFTIRAAKDTWAEHWEPMPRRDYHDLFAMLPKGLAHIDGDLVALMQNLQFFKDVLAAPRRREV